MLLYANMWGILMVNATIYTAHMDPMGSSTVYRLDNRWGIHRNGTNVVSPNMRYVAFALNLCFRDPEMFTWKKEQTKGVQCLDVS